MSDEVKTYSDDIKALGDKIVALTLLQAKDLADYLKDEYGIEPAAGGGSHRSRSGQRRSSRGREDLFRRDSEGSRGPEDQGYQGSSRRDWSGSERSQRPGRQCSEAGQRRPEQGRCRCPSQDSGRSRRDRRDRLSQSAAQGIVKQENSSRRRLLEEPAPGLCPEVFNLKVNIVVKHLCLRNFVRGS